MIKKSKALEKKEIQPLELKPEIVSSLVIKGDLSGLNETQKVQYYNTLCERIGIDPATQPFKLIKFTRNNVSREILYADKGATQQLCKIYNISTEVRAKEDIGGVYVVTVRASNGARYTDEDGAVSIQGQKGEYLANSMMKAITKAKRRAVLALCGLGMLDETEVEAVHMGQPEKQEEEPQKTFSPPQDIGRAEEAEISESQEEKEPEETEPENMTQEQLNKLISTAIDNKYLPADIQVQFESLGYAIKGKITKALNLSSINPEVNQWDYETILDSVSTVKKNETQK